MAGSRSPGHPSGAAQAWPCSVLGTCQALGRASRPLCAYCTTSWHHHSTDRSLCPAPVPTGHPHTPAQAQALLAALDVCRPQQHLKTQPSGQGQVCSLATVPHPPHSPMAFPGCGKDRAQWERPRGTRQGCLPISIPEGLADLEGWPWAAFLWGTASTASYSPPAGEASGATPGEAGADSHNPRPDTRPSLGA